MLRRAVLRLRIVPKMAVPRWPPRPPGCRDDAAAPTVAASVAAPAVDVDAAAVAVDAVAVAAVAVAAWTMERSAGRWREAKAQR